MPEPLTSEEWKALWEIDSPEELERIIRYYIWSGKITETQAEGLWDAVITTTGTQAYQKRVQSLEQEARGKAFQEEQQRLFEKYNRFRKSATPGVQPEMKAWERTPEPEYMSEWKEMGKTAGVPQTERWQGWLQSKYGPELQAFTSQLKPFQEKYWRETVSDYYGEGPSLEPWEYERQKSPEEVEKEVEASWAALLKKKQPEYYEQWYRQTPYERGERPSAFAPRLQTLGFR